MGCGCSKFSRCCWGAEQARPVAEARQGGKMNGDSFVVRVILYVMW